MAAAARWQAGVLGTEHDVWLVSDTLPDETTTFRGLKVSRPLFRVLRRLAHVPSEVFFAIRVQRAIARLHAEQSVDLVIYNNHSLLGVRVPRALRKVPALVVTHADIFDRPDGSYDPRVIAFYKWVARRAYALASVVIANSTYTAERVRRIAPDSRIEVLHVPVALSDIDCPTQLPKSLEASPGRDNFRLLFVGRLAHEKGLDILLDAFRILVERAFRVELVIVGDGPLVELVAEAQRDARDRARVIHIPWQPRSSLAAIYRCADVLCIPSRNEPLGLVAIEALHCGIPVVAADVGGLRDVIRHGTDGELVPSENPKQLAEAVVRVAESSGHRSRTPDAGWLEQFSPGKIGRRLLVLAASSSCAGGGT